MATNQIFEPLRTRSLEVPADTPSGTPLMVGALPVVTLTKEGEGGNADGFATCALDGAFGLDSTAAFTAGQLVYITSGGVINATASGNTLFGAALKAKSAGAGTVAVEIGG